MHTQIYARGLGKCENRPPRHLHATLTPEHHGQENCHTTRPRTASPLCEKALPNHHREHARAKLGARPRQVRKRTRKITSALECSAQAHRIHTWEHVEVINRHETLHSPHTHHAKDGGVRYGSGVRLGSRRIISISVLARACSRCVVLKWSGTQYWGSKRKTTK